jgi:hypothetical protein
VNTVSPGPVRTAWWIDEGGAADILAAPSGSNRDDVMDKIASGMMKLTTGREGGPTRAAQRTSEACAARKRCRCGSTASASADAMQDEHRAPRFRIPGHPGLDVS